MLSFTTRENFIDFKYTEDVIPYQVHNVITLHKTSKCITWGFGENATNIDFKIDDITYNEIPITSIYFDGVVMSVQADFKTKIEAMFPGLATGSSEEGGGSSYLVYMANLEYAGAATPPTVVQLHANTIGDNPVWTYNVVSEAWELTIVGGFMGQVGLVCQPGAFCALEKINNDKVRLYVYSNTYAVDIAYWGFQSMIEIRAFPL